MESTLLTTGDVARALNVSRQHVVNMCDRGEIDSVKIGAHRRVPFSEVDRLTGAVLTRERERSLWLHRAVVVRLLIDPDGSIAIAKDNLAKLRRQHRSDGMTRKYLDDWDRIIEAGLDDISETLTSPSEHASELRQNSPFAGTLPAEDRARILKNFAAHWAQDHGTVA